MSALSAAEARVTELQDTLARAQELVIQLDTALREVKARISLFDRLAISVPLSGLVSLLYAARRSAPPCRPLALVPPRPTDDSHEVAK